MNNLDSILKSRDFTLPTKIHNIKAVVFPVVMYGCESWTIRKAECQRIDAFELWCWRTATISHVILSLISLAKYELEPGGEIFEKSANAFPLGFEASVCVCISYSVVSDSLWPHGLWPTRLFCPWYSLGKNTRVVCHFLLQGIFPSQGSNLSFLHCRPILYCLKHQGSPRIRY